jgi:hypothetical protein
MILGDAAVNAAPMDANVVLWDKIKNHIKMVVRAVCNNEYRTHHCRQSATDAVKQHLKTVAANAQTKLMNKILQLSHSVTKDTNGLEQLFQASCMIDENLAFKEVLKASKRLVPFHHWLSPAPDRSDEHARPAIIPITAQAANDASDSADAMSLSPRVSLDAPWAAAAGDTSSAAGDSDGPQADGPKKRTRATNEATATQASPLAADAFIAAFSDGGTKNEALAASPHQSLTSPPPRPLAPPPQAASGGSAAEEVFALASVVSSSSKCGNACEGEDALATHWCSSLLAADMLY